MLAAIQIALEFRDHKAKVAVFVPLYAMSGGALIALAARRDCHVQTRRRPIDPQIGQLSVASLIKVVEQKPVAEIDDNTLIMADVGQKAIAQVKAAAREILDRRLSPQAGGNACGDAVIGTVDA